MLDGAHEKVVQPLVVGERRLGEWLAATPAADEMEECVGAGEALLQRIRPLAGAVVAEEVGDARVAAVVGQGEILDQRVETARIDVAQRQGRAGVGQPRATVGPSPPPAPAIAITRPSRSIIRASLANPIAPGGRTSAVGSRARRASTRLP